MQVTFIGIQQSSKICCQAKPRHTSKRQTLGQGMLVREVFRLIVATIGEFRKTIHKL